jgi:hypothetical protein
MDSSSFLNSHHSLLQTYKNDKDKKKDELSKDTNRQVQKTKTIKRFDSNQMLKVCFTVIESYNLGFENHYIPVSLALVTEKLELTLTNC